MGLKHIWIFKFEMLTLNFRVLNKHFDAGRGHYIEV